MTVVARISREEWGFVILFSLVLLSVTVVPLVIGYLMQNEEYRFVGFVNPHEDMNSYLSWMKQAREGHILFEEKFSSEPQPRNIFLLYFLIVGVLSQLLHIPLIIMHQIMRIICGFAILSSAYVFVAYFVKDTLKRKVIFLLISFSSGFGFYFASLHHFLGFSLPRLFQIPCDQIHSQSITFWGIDWDAHSQISIALMLFVFLFILEGFRTEKRFLLFCAGLLTIIVILIHPYKVLTVVPAASIFAFYTVLKNRKKLTTIVSSWTVLILLSSLAVIFMWIQFMQNTIVQAWYNYQPFFYNIFGYILGTGFIFLMSIFSVFKIIKGRREDYYFLLIWSSITLVFLHIPFITFRMRLVEGLHIGLCILSGLGLFWLMEKLGWTNNGSLKTRGAIFVSLFIILSAPSNFMYINLDIKMATSFKYPYFLPRDIVKVLDWMDNNLTKDKIVLASREIGSFIPARTGLKTYVGHVAETLYKHRKLEELGKVMDSKTNNKFRTAILRGNKINYLLISDFERRLGDFDPAKEEYLEEIYRSGSVSLYRVKFN